MKNVLLVFSCVLFLFPSAKAQKKLFTETPTEKEARMEWWVNDRFGMFIHWGIYALPARHEWIKSIELHTDAGYQNYFDFFDPDLFNPKQWAKEAKEAGMKYAVITTKHHDGFCLFDSKFTDYSSVNTPYGKDIIREFVDAFRAEGLKVGFYYSLIDWHHPDFTIDVTHPQRPELNKEYEALNKGEYKSLNKGRDMDKYRTYLHNQVRELLTNYGKIDIIWLDYSYAQYEQGKGSKDWDSEKLLRMVRELQPQILVNDRLDLRDYEDGWDFTTPEQFKVSKWPELDGRKVHWETCQTFSGSWGYNREENTWKNERQLLGLLIESVSKGGNLLLNVGPTGRGVFDDRAHAALTSIGEWMYFNSRSIYGCTQAPVEFEHPDNCLLTYNPVTNRLYIHILEYPLTDFNLPGYYGKVKYAQFLHDASEIKIAKHPEDWINKDEKTNDLNLKLPVIKPNIEIPVIELMLE